MNYRERIELTGIPYNWFAKKCGVSKTCFCRDFSIKDDYAMPKKVEARLILILEEMERTLLIIDKI